MVKKIFGVYDKKMSEYSSTFIDNHVAQMVRGLEKVLQSPNSQIAEYPEDFDIYFLGDIDLITGKIKCPVNPEYVLSCAGQLRELISKNEAKGKTMIGTGNTTEMLHKNIAELERRLKPDLDKIVQQDITKNGHVVIKS